GVTDRGPGTSGPRPIPASHSGTPILATRVRVTWSRGVHAPDRGGPPRTHPRTHPPPPRQHRPSPPHQGLAQAHTRSPTRRLRHRHRHHAFTHAVTRFDNWPIALS